MQLPKFNNQDLLRQAFLHRSFLNEHRDEKQSNERLEFLGDSILSYVTSSWLYETMPEKPEGDLTNLRSKLVNTKSLAAVATRLGLGEKLYLSKGEEDGGGRLNTSLLADTYEATIGALYLDGGLDACKHYIHSTLLASVEDLDKDLKDPKSLLQEVIQARKQPSPVYKVIAEQGPDHNKVFTVAVEINGNSAAQGSGKSKREAETSAASAALAILSQT